MRIPGPNGLSGTEAIAAAAGSGRRLLKGPCPQLDFHSNGLASSEHQCQVSCSGGTREV